MRFLFALLFLATMSLVTGLWGAGSGRLHVLYSGQSEATFGPCG